MKTITNSFAKLAVLSAILAVVLTVNYLNAAWTGPTASAPNNNVDAPVNIGSTAQVKAGGLSIDSNFSVAGWSIFGNNEKSADGDLTVDVEGKIGADEYCNGEGVNCHPISDLYNAYIFGGMYVTDSSNVTCYNANVFTGSCSCPNYFDDELLHGGDGVDRIYYCFAPSI